MDIVHTIQDFWKARQWCGTIGFVPTMGYLHEGHLELVRNARAECESVVVSIFVNPTQFGPNEDFESYPRDSVRDLQMLIDEGVDIVFLPEVKEIYPQGFSSYVQVDGVTERLEGASRPTHFRGVTTVVCKLFNIVRPSCAYFGQKDAQQFMVIRKMVEDLDMPLEVAMVTTVREVDGLAMSSRNTYLAPNERDAATILYRALQAAEQRYKKSVRDANALRKAMQTKLDQEPLAQVEYVSVAHPRTLQELDKIGADGALLSLAVRIGKTRLIDNMFIAESHEIWRT